MNLVLLDWESKYRLFPTPVYLTEMRMYIFEVSYGPLKYSLHSKIDLTITQQMAKYFYDKRANHWKQYEHEEDEPMVIRQLNGISKPAKDKNIDLSLS